MHQLTVLYELKKKRDEIRNILLAVQTSPCISLCVCNTYERYTRSHLAAAASWASESSLSVKQSGLCCFTFFILPSARVCLLLFSPYRRATDLRNLQDEMPIEI